MMKKILILVVISLLSLQSIAQERHRVHIANTDIVVTAMKDATEDNFDTPPYEFWLDTGYEVYVMLFKMTPVGYKHSIDRVKEILANNDLSFENDRFKESILIPTRVSGYDDYHDMVHPLKMGEAEVVISWLTNDDDLIILNCNDEAFMVGLGNYEDFLNYHNGM